MKMTNDKGKYSQYLTVAGNYFANKGWVHLLLAGGLYILYKMFFRTSLPFFLTISSLPLMTVIFLLIIKYSKQSFYTLFILQFLLAAAYAVTDIPLGVATLMCTLFAVVLLFAYGMHEKIDWSESRNGMLMLFLIWGVYCILEIANPNNVQAAWNISITHYLIYPIVCAVIVPLAIRNIKGIQWLLIIWSLFILLAAAKGYWQKNCGFNEREQYFLYVLGGARTHIIWSGIRYFSFFSDAANFGVHMAMGISLFGISLFYIKGVWLKIYFILVIIAAIYGMGISGTRAAIASSAYRCFREFHYSFTQSQSMYYRYFSSCLVILVFRMYQYRR